MDENTALAEAMKICQSDNCWTLTLTASVEFKVPLLSNSFSNYYDTSFFVARLYFSLSLKFCSLFIADNVLSAYFAINAGAYLYSLSLLVEFRRSGSYSTIPSDFRFSVGTCFGTTV